MNKEFFGEGIIDIIVMYVSVDFMGDRYDDSLYKMGLWVEGVVKEVVEMGIGEKREFKQMWVLL